MESMEAGQTQEQNTIDQMISFDTFSINPDKATALEIASAISHMGVSKGIEGTPEKGTLMPLKDTLGRQINWDDIVNELSVKGTTLYVPAMPNMLGDGDVASNFRFKHDKDINSDVIQKWINVFTINAKMKNPLVVTTVQRKERYLTLNMPEDGTVKVVNNQTNRENSDLSKMFTNFLIAFNIDEEKMKVIRQASEGAKFNTYLSDMIGFMNIVNWGNGNVSMFTKQQLEAHVETEGEVYHRAEVKGEPIIKPVVINDREWKPKKGYSYMYFRRTDKATPTLQEFYMLKDGQMTTVYSQIFQAISMDENKTKENVRNFMVNHNYCRLSDFWVNDVDDGFTLLMIMNCFDEDEVELTEEEIAVKENLEVIYETVFH